MKVDQLEEFLRSAMCFAVLNDEQLAKVRDRTEIRQYKLGEVVFRQGDAGDGMYLVYSGKVRVLRDEGEREVPLNTLYSGEHFGELAVINQEPRTATIRAAADCTLIRVPGEPVRELLAQNEDLEEYFGRYSERLELWNFVKLVGRIGGEIKPAQLRRLVDQFQDQQFPAGEEILAEEQVPQRFFLIQSGRVKVAREGQVEATLTQGDTFGGSLLLEEPAHKSPWSIRAEGEVSVQTLQAEEFRRLLADAPALRRFFAEQTAHHRADEAPAHFDSVSQQLEEDQKADTETLLGEAAESAQLAQLQADAAAMVEQPAETIEAEAPAEAAPPQPQPGPLARWWRRWRFPHLPQHEEADCGAACLAMITAYHGHTVGVSRLRDLARVSTEGASLAQLVEASQKIGYQARCLRMSADALDRLQLPAVLFWRGYHYVVLYAITDKHAYIADPAFGKLRIAREDLSREYSGFAMEVTPTEAAGEVRARSQATGRLLQLMGVHKAPLIWIIVCTVLLYVFGLAAPLFTQAIVDKVFTGDELFSTAGMQLLNILLLGMVLVSLMQIVTTLARGYLAVILSQSMDRTLLREFYTHLVSLPTRFFKLRRTGDIVARFGDNEHVRDLFTAGTITAILDSVMVVVYFGVMFYMDARLAWVVLAVVPLYVIFTLLVSPVMKRQFRHVLEDEAAENSNLIETVGGIDLVKSMAIERSLQKKWEGLFNKSLASQRRNQILGEAFGAVGSALQVLSTVALLWYGAVLVLRDMDPAAAVPMAERFTAGALMAFSMLAGQVTGPLSRVIGLWEQLQQARVSLERMSDVLDNEPEPQPPEDARVYPHNIRGAVTFDRVFFRYGGPTSPYSLRSVSFEAKPGQRIAIVGRSGSGKTTLARLLLGLYRPSEGRVVIDGHDLDRLDLTTFRRQVGVVLQENLLFSGTIKENIALGDADPDEQRMQEAATLAGAHDFISAMPLAYNTVVGELGLTLSGGQRQRISIARALYGNPRILIFDEATSALDSLSEREIQRNLDSMLADRTAFIIAHKISTVRDADLILVLHDGVIVEQGLHDELIEKRGTYYYLAAQQLNL